MIDNLADSILPISSTQSQKMIIKRVTPSIGTSSIPIHQTTSSSSSRSLIKESAITRSQVNNETHSSTRNTLLKEKEWSRLLQEAYSEPIQTYSTTPTHSSFKDQSIQSTHINESQVTNGSIPSFNKYVTKKSDYFPPTPKINLHTETKTRLFNLRFANIYPTFFEVQQDKSSSSSSMFTVGLKLHHPKTGSSISYTRSSTKFSFLNTSNVSIRSNSLHQYLTNSLQLHLQLNILSNTDEIISWSCCGLVTMLEKYVHELNGQMGVYIHSKFQTIQSLKDTSVREQGVYLMVSKEMLNVFRLGKLASFPIEDPQRLEVLYSIGVTSLRSIVFGPRDLYATIIFTHQQQDKSETISILLLFRTPTIYQSLLEFIDSNNIENCVMRDQSRLADQIKESILLKKGKKEIMVNHGSFNIHSLPWLQSSKLRKTWKQYLLFTIQEIKTDSIDDACIIEECEYDVLGQLPILPPSLCFQMYQLVGLILKSSQQPQIYVKTCSLLSTSDFIYLFIERLDLQQTTDHLKEAEINDKGILSDIMSIVDDHSIIRVARTKDILKCEKWKSWRWTSETVDQINQTISHTAQSIYNGMIGHSIQEYEKCIGWFYWLRITLKDGCGDVIDIVYVDDTGQEVLVFTDWLKKYCDKDVQFIDGDD